MTEHSFDQWLMDRNISDSIGCALKLAISYAGRDEYASQMVDDFEGIVEYTDESPIDVTPFEMGFIVFGWCPNGDPVAIRFTEPNGVIYYLSHEEMLDDQIPARQVANSMIEFLEKAGSDGFPLDYHEASDFSV